MAFGMSVSTIRQTWRQRDFRHSSFRMMVWAWAVRNGLLDKKTYLPVIIKAWNAMVKDAVHPNGFLGYVQGTGKEPKDSQPVTYDKFLILRISEQDVSFLPEVKSIN